MKNTCAILFLFFISSTLFAQNIDSELATIRANISAFSRALMDGDTIAVINAYTHDGKILPQGTDILSGESLKAYWCKGIRNGQTYYYHKITPIEIKVLGEYAYDYGYYEGESGYDNKRSKWKGKYVIVWRKVENNWKIYLDIWNGIPLTD